MTQYVLSLSYGKDSLACLGAIEKLGLPLDRIIHAEVWATDTIPADLPPMVEFKKKADAIIKERWGITVEHIYATKPREREREKVCYADLFYESHDSPIYGEHINGFPKVRGGWCKRLKYSRETDIRKYLLSTSKNPEGGGATGFTDSPWSRGIGVRAISSNGLCDKVEPVLHGRTQTQQYYGFPISVHQGNWCTALKQRVFRQHPGTRCGHKYRAIPRNCGRRTRTD